MSFYRVMTKAKQGWLQVAPMHLAMMKLMVRGFQCQPPILAEEGGDLEPVGVQWMVQTRFLQEEGEEEGVEGKRDRAATSS